MPAPPAIAESTEAEHKQLAVILRTGEALPKLPRHSHPSCFGSPLSISICRDWLPELPPLLTPTHHEPKTPASMLPMPLVPHSSRGGESPLAEPMPSYPLSRDPPLAPPHPPPEMLFASNVHPCLYSSWSLSFSPVSGSLEPGFIAGSLTSCGIVFIP